MTNRPPTPRTIQSNAIARLRAAEDQAVAAARRAMSMPFAELSKLPTRAGDELRCVLGTAKLAIRLTAQAENGGVSDDRRTLRRLGRLTAAIEEINEGQDARDRDAGQRHREACDRRRQLAAERAAAPAGKIRTGNGTARD